MNKKRQLVLATFLSRTMYFGLGTSYVFHYGKKMTILGLTIGIILGYLILKFLLIKNIKSFFKTKIGLVIILFLSFLLVNNALIAFSIMGSNFYLLKTPPLLIIIPLFILILYGVKKGLKAILRLSDILIFVSMIILVLIFTSIGHNIVFNNFLPLDFKLSRGFLNVIISSMAYSITPLLLELAIVDSPDKKSIEKGYLLGSFSILLMVIYIAGIFGTDFATRYRYPEYILLKKVNLFQEFLHLETFLAIIWFNDLLITSLLAGFLIASYFKGNKLYIVSIIHLLFNYLFFINNYQHILLIYHYTIYVLLVPLLLTLFLSKRSF